ncbi:MAG: acetate kinase [Clostridia bacterium]
MKILVLNAGSSSLKYQLINMQNDDVIAKGNCEKIGIKGSFITHTANGEKKLFEKDLVDHQEAIEKVLSLLTDKTVGVIASLKEISAVGHRVVHGGEIFKESVVINATNLKKIESLVDLAPLHQPANILGIKACQKVMPQVKQVAVFDTAFHANMPDYSYMYALPYEYYKNLKIRRYGFHGTSHRFVSSECAKLMRRDLKDLKIITIHLGNGSSISAIKNGISIDTSMGFTPLEGVMMGTRCGTIDASVVGYLAEKLNLTAKQVVDILNKKSGVLGINGVSPDMRENNAEIKKGNVNAQLVIHMLAYQIKKYVGAYTAAMGGLDAIVFTGGIGENQEDVREISMSDMKFFGIRFDSQKNYKMQRGTTEQLNKGGKVKIYRIPTNEELVIAKDTFELTNKK